MTSYQLFEWEVRRFAGEASISQAHAVSLVEAAEGPSQRLKGKPKVFDFRRDALVAQNVVGIVAAKDATCEILPKVDHDAAGDARTLRHQLIGMLSVAHDLPIADDVTTALDTQNETLLEILIARFAATLAEAIRRGLPRAYVTHEEDIPALRGRLDVTRQFSTLAATPHRLACRFDEFSHDIPINQVIRAAIMRLRTLARSAANQRVLADLAMVYADVSPVEPSRLAWHAITPDRANMRWMALIRLAKLILGNRFQNTVHGRDDGFALLFDMNVLFERYVEKLLDPIARALGWTPHPQGGGHHCLHPEDKTDPLFATWPDIQLMRCGETEVIIDTKWKALVDRTVDRKMKISQDDIYQLMAYAQLYACDSLVLLYPHHAKLASPLPFRFQIGAPDGPIQLTIATVDLSEHDAARANLSHLLKDLRTGSWRPDAIG